MMTGYSATQPEPLVRHNGGYQLRYNVEQVTREIDGQPVTEWKFAYVNVSAIDRGTVIDALITARYSYPSQFGKLALDRASAEWLEYDAFRQECYAVADGLA